MQLGMFQLLKFGELIPKNFPLLLSFLKNIPKSSA